MFTRIVSGQPSPAIGPSVGKMGSRLLAYGVVWWLHTAFTGKSLPVYKKVDSSKPGLLRVCQNWRPK